MEAINDEFSGDLKRSLVAFCSQILEGQATFHAKCLYEAMKGIGTDDSEVIRIISSRSEVSLTLYMYMYVFIYTLRNEIKATKLRLSKVVDTENKMVI